MRSVARSTLALLSLTAAAASAQSGPASSPMPVKYAGPATVPAITAGDLMTRLYKYADDSMMGRRVGTEYNIKATAYIESEVRRLGLKPAGDNGGYFQDIGVRPRAFDSTSTLTVDGVTYVGGKDFLATQQGIARQGQNVRTIYWGTVFDTLNQPTPEQYKGAVVFMGQGAQPAGFNAQAFIKSEGYKRYLAMINSPDVLARATIAPGDSFPTATRNNVMHPVNGILTRQDTLPTVFSLRQGLGALVFGVPSSQLKPGATGKAMSWNVRWTDGPSAGRNVVAILPGSDPKLKNEYVAIGAHNDHIGFNSRPLEHDSIKAFNMVALKQGADDPRKAPTAEQWVEINRIKDSLRAIYPARPDSISNGADDDGSGTVSVLEIAEAFAKSAVKPKRSILFVWHTGEESGMWGSGYFMDHPTVPRESIVAQLNIDMVGRGAPTDVTGNDKDGGLLKGDTKYVQLVGSHRLSKDLGDLIETVNKDPKFGFRLDYGLDANGHPQNIYCRSDHWSYAKWGVPVVFFTTGGHADYHQVTDEPQYIRYDHMANLDQMIMQAAMSVANLNHRVKVDVAGPFDPKASCQQ